MNAPVAPNVPSASVPRADEPAAASAEPHIASVERVVVERVVLEPAWAPPFVTHPPAKPAEPVAPAAGSLDVQSDAMAVKPAPVASVAPEPAAPPPAPAPSAPRVTTNPFANLIGGQGRSGRASCGTRHHRRSDRRSRLAGFAAHDRQGRSRNGGAKSCRRPPNVWCRKRSSASSRHDGTENQDS